MTYETRTKDYAGDAQRSADQRQSVDNDTYLKDAVDAMGGSGGSTRISLPAAAWMPTSDVASWASAQAQVKQSSGAVPSPRWLEWLFDTSTDEFIVTQLLVPENYVSTPVLKVYYKAASATSGTAAFEARVAAISDGDTQDMDADAFATVNAGQATVPAVAGRIDVITITLTNADSMAAGDHLIIALNRDVSADSVAGDLEVFACEFQYSDA